MPAQKRFVQARIKRKWANTRIIALHREWEHFLQTDFCEVVVENLSNDRQAIRAIAKSPPEAITLTLGDAVHNLRAALDYTISEILGWQNKRITFPMHETREDLEESFRVQRKNIGNKIIKQGTNAPIENAAPGIGTYICDFIKPYRSSGNLLWSLGKLDNTDKHRLLIAIAAPRAITIVEAASDNGSTMENATIILDDSGYKDIAEFGGGGLTIKGVANPEADLILNEPLIIDRQNILSVLIEMSKQVGDTIDKLDEFLSSRGS